MTTQRITRADLLDRKANREPIAMLTAYDYPTARRAAEAGVHMLLVGDSCASVVLGHDSTRPAPLELMIVLAEAVRRGAPGVCLVGDIPFEAMTSDYAAQAAARRFRDEADCDMVKLEVDAEHAGWVRKIARDGIDVIAHLGLRPQQVTDPAGYRAQARESAEITALVAQAQRMQDAECAMILLEAVPNEATAAVMEAVSVPVIGCGAGPACDGHVVVTQDMLGCSFGSTPRFVPVLGDLGERTDDAMRRYVEDIVSRQYPAPEHVYPMKRPRSTCNS